MSLHLNLITIQDWACPWKMSFNTDRDERAQEVTFSHKTRNIICPNLYFNELQIVKTTSQKHIGLNINLTIT